MSDSKIFRASMADHAVNIVVALALCTGLLLLASRNIPPRVVAVDVQALMEEQQHLLMQRLGVPDGQALSAQQRDIGERMGAEFAKSLSDAVDQLADSCNCVLVNKAALLGGAVEDVTDLIRNVVRR